MTQLVARIPESLAEELDRLVAEGGFESRSDVVREALVRFIDAHRRYEIGRHIVEGYTRTPQTDDDLGWVDAATRAMIEEEPW